MKKDNVSFRMLIFCDDDGKEKKHHPKQKSQNIFWFWKILKKKISIIRGKTFMKKPHSEINGDEGKCKN